MTTRKINAHELWLKTNGKEGEQANFSDKVLRYAYTYKNLKAHKLWLKTGGEEGKRADFSGQNLERWYFASANLSGAIFKNATLTNSYFYNANLNYVDFTDANLEGVTIERATLENTGIFTFQIEYFSFFHQSTAYPNGYLLRIGCKDYFDLDDRIARNDEICKKFGYTDLQTEKMLEMLIFIKENILDK